MTTPVVARLVRSSVAGSWRIFATPAGGKPIEISFFRGVPTQLNSFGFADPFGPQDLSMSFPKISVLDHLGTGDLWWLGAETDIDLVWVGPLPPGHPDYRALLKYSSLLPTNPAPGYPLTPRGGWRWQGFIESYEFSSEGLAVSCMGAMLQLDHYLAKPEYPSRPIPYEWAIGRQFRGRADLRMSPMMVEWPAWWKTTYVPVKGAPSYLVPTAVSVGSNWTGLVTRTTGNWDAVLTSYIQTLLTSMYTERGRWTLDLAAGRVPVLVHRDIHFSPSDIAIVIDPVAPDVELSLSVDWSQSLNVVYGQGSSLAGAAYSGMQVSPDGLVTSYAPLAALRQVHPATDKNGWLQKSRMRKEVMLQLQPGLDQIDAAKVATAHLARFADPGVTGSITIGSDPKLGDAYLPRVLIKAGMTVQLPNVFGRPEGLLLHISRVSVNLSAGKVTLTVDSKYRDALTVDEVRIRGRDSLSVSRMLIAGQFTPPIPDQLLPWNYAEGSGYIPSSPELSSLRLFRNMPAEITFPWTEWTTKHPPSSPSWRSSYVRIGPKSSIANNNWAAISDATGAKLGIPIKMAQAGTIRLIQIAAFDRNGNVLKVPFHISLYLSRGVNALSTPTMPSSLAVKYPPYLGGQHYPFFENAWETYNIDGTKANPQTTPAEETAGLVRAYGTYYEKAGHWPGSSRNGDPATGLFVDENQFSFDTTNFADANFSPYSPTANQTNPLAGRLYAMIYCDAQGAGEVFFAGRMFRVEPGVVV